jgi:hypothetical protein
MSRAPLTTALLFLLTGCATGNQAYTDNLATWHGHNISEIVAQHGVPARTIDLPDGTKAYEYTGNEHSSGWQSRNALTGGTDTTVVNSRCLTTFMTDSAGTIIGTRWRGNC